MDEAARNALLAEAAEIRKQGELLTRRYNEIAALLISNGTPEVQHQIPVPDFRLVHWGASPEDIKQKETEELVAELEDGSLGYSTSVAGLDATLVYQFVEGKLVSTIYGITEQHSNDNAFITDFVTLKDILTNKYGTAREDETYWSNEVYRDDFQQWGMAISSGHVSFKAVWTTERTRIFLLLGGDNYEVHMSIKYESLIHLSLADKNQRQKQLQGL